LAKLILGERNVDQAVEHRIIGYVGRIEAKLDQQLFDPEVFALRIRERDLSIAGRSILALPIHPSPRFARAGPGRNRATKKTRPPKTAAGGCPQAIVYSDPACAWQECFADQQLRTAPSRSGGTAKRLHQTDIQKRNKPVAAAL